LRQFSCERMNVRARSMAVREAHRFGFLKRVMHCQSFVFVFNLSLPVVSVHHWTLDAKSQRDVPSASTAPGAGGVVAEDGNLAVLL
jgi:hypothetical protein